jgi:glycosyltransferase involved in cell wall biosynthesis
VPIGGRLRPVASARAAWRLRRLLAGADPDVVHAHGLRAGALAALALRPLPIARWPGGRTPPLLVTVHNAPPAKVGTALIYAALERLVVRRADAVLCVSPDLAARMRGLRAKDVGPAVVAAPPMPRQAQVPRAAPGGAGEVARGAPVRAELAAEGRPVVLAVARLAPQKGIDTLLEAAARWRVRRPEPLVVIAGTGPLARDLARQAAGLGVAPRFLGPRADVPALLAAADVFVLPSRWEGQPMILQEALRAGRPIVATDVGGVRDLAGDEAALLVQAGDPAALAVAVARVLDDPLLASGLAEAALARAAMLPTEADAVAAALAHYERLARRLPARDELEV